MKTISLRIEEDLLNDLDLMKTYEEEMINHKVKLTLTDMIKICIKEYLYHNSPILEDIKENI